MIEGPSAKTHKFTSGSIGVLKIDYYYIYIYRTGFYYSILILNHTLYIIMLVLFFNIMHCPEV